MRLSRVEIRNFRNFANCGFDLTDNAVIVGENKIGKSNLVFALRLLLDPSMSDADRQLRPDDFWDGLPRPLTADDTIEISAYFADFEDNELQLSILGTHPVQHSPLVTKFTYLFRPISTLDNPPTKGADYEYVIFGGDRVENEIHHSDRKWFPLNVVPALRNVADDLFNWRRSPLAPLLKQASARIDRAALEAVSSEIAKATKVLTGLDEIKAVEDQISSRMRTMVGGHHGMDTSLGFSPTHPDRLVRDLRVFFDQGTRGIAEASLGTSNLLYLSLLSLDLERQVSERQRHHTFLAIEEPEAHLHPHLQRLAFRDFLRLPSGARPATPTSPTSPTPSAPAPTAPQAPSLNVIVTTHSPHIASVAPLRSIVLLRKAPNGGTVASSAAGLNFPDRTMNDLERYLDVNRGEMLFARGVLLVEGAAEQFVLPQFGAACGVDFDEIGISVCSVEGTNFEPYVRLLGPDGLNMPFAVLTDLDPGNGARGVNLGEDRCLRLLDALLPIGHADRGSQSAARAHGIFLNSHTLEVELFRSGQHEALCTTIDELSENEQARTRAAAWKVNPDSVDILNLLSDIRAIGKGRFAQRLAANLSPAHVPTYIREAIEHVHSRIRTA